MDQHPARLPAPAAQASPRAPGLLAALLALSALAACGNGAGGATPDGARLSPLGPAAVRVHPGGRLRLQVVLAEAGRGPVASVPVEFVLPAQGASGARLDAASALTDAGGIASVELTAGEAGAAPFPVTARVPDRPSVEPASFAVSVVPVRRLLRIEPAAAVEVAADGQSARARIAPAGSLWLAVRARDADTQAPLAGDAVAFAVGGSSSAARFAGGSAQATATTDAAGEARVLLVAPLHPETFPVSASAVGDPAEGVLLFDVAVAADASACPPCPGGQSCDPAARACVPDPAGPPDVTGAWRVQHVFALDGALPPGLATAFAALRTLDQALSGALGLPSWLQSLLGGIVDRFVPDWARVAVRIGDTLATLLRHLRSEGTLRLSAAGPSALSGSEAWTSLSVYFLPQCCPGGPLSGSCAALQGDPTEPLACARVRIPVGASAAGQCQGRPLPGVGVDVAPFQAALSGSGPSRDRAPFSLQVGPRQVGLRMGTVALAEVDALLARFTPWHCVEEATDCSGGSCAVDCRNLGATLSHVSFGLLDAGSVERACGGAVAVAGLEVSRALETAVFETSALQFSGHARVAGFAGDGAGDAPPGGAACDSGVRCAGQLGSFDFDQQTRADARAGTHLRDGSWEGSFFRRAPAAMPGGWEATR